MRTLCVVAAIVLSLACRAETGVVGGDVQPAKRSVPQLDPERLAHALAIPQDSLAAVAQERYSDQSFDTAQALFRAEAARALRAHDAKAEARARMWIGLAAWRLGDYSTARTEGERSLTMKRGLAMDDELARSFNALGLLAWNEGRPRDALELFDSAVTAARRHHDLANGARAAANIPLVKVDLGDFDGAAHDFPAALAIARAAKDEKVAANDLANFAMLRIRLGEPRSAAVLLDRARDGYAKIKYVAGEANALGQLATAWSELGDLQRAIVAADSALSIARNQGLQQEMAAELEVLSDLHAQAGDLRLALRDLSAADSLDEKLGLAIEHGNNLRRTASILETLSDPAGAARRARLALAVHRKTESVAEVIYDRLIIARVNAADARAQIDTATLESVREGNHVIAHDVAIESARYALAASDPRRALATLDRSPPNSELTDWQTPDLRASAYQQLGGLVDADRESARSLGALERERASLGLGPLRSRYLADRVGPFSRAIAIKLARGDTVAAFRIAASVPGRSLLERLGTIEEPSKAIASYAAGERLLLHAASIEQELSELANDSSSTQRRLALQNQLQNVQAEYTAYLGRNATSGAIAQATAPSLSDIQSRLSGDEALLLFVAGPDRTDAFLVGRGQIHYAAVQAPGPELVLRVRAVRDLINRRGARTAALQALGELRAQLLGGFVDAGDLSEIRHLVIVPHAALTALPFAALWNAKTHRFLVEDYTITTLPSVAAVASTKSVGPLIQDLLAIAPQPAALPGSEREVKAIARILPGVEVKIGEASTEPLVRSALTSGRPLHIAAHGIHEPQSPLFSRLTVAAHNSPLPGVDGFLHVHEIVGLTIRSSLVFLSGCETALGSGVDNAFVGGDDNSIATAFLLAGAETVVATLWKVGDEDAARMAASFYAQLRSGRSAAEALAKSQRALLASDSSFDWAAYTVAVTGTPSASQ
ncbi:MAG: CHAT domain-containing protein [Gemmatimonadaceae bacterium]